MHIRPWEVGNLTVEQFDQACRAIDEYHRQRQKEASAE